MAVGTLARRIAVGATLLILLAACSGDGDEGDADAGRRQQTGQDRSARLSDVEEGAGGGTTVTADEANLQEDDLSIGPSVIKTADMRVEVGADAVGDAVGDATAIATGAGGFVVSSQVDDADGGRANLVLRVPADRFEQTLAGLGDLGEVDSEAVAGEDVSQEFIDLEARLRNATAQEAVLLRLMDESQTIADTIRVQQQLQQTQLEIERLRGRIRYLEDRTAFGTISVGFVEGGAPPPSDPSTLARAWDLARGTVGNIVGGVVIGAAVVLPVAVLVALALAIGMVVYRRVRPRVATLFK
jgi:hypothetical protein